MTTIELKKQLIEQISKVDDVSHLEAVKTLLDTKMVRGTIILSEEQKAALDAARFIQMKKLIKESGHGCVQNNLDASCKIKDAGNFAVL